MKSNSRQMMDVIIISKYHNRVRKRRRRVWPLSKLYTKCWPIDRQSKMKFIIAIVLFVVYCFSCQSIVNLSFATSSISNRYKSLPAILDIAASSIGSQQSSSINDKDEDYSDYSTSVEKPNKQQVENFKLNNELTIKTKDNNNNNNNNDDNQQIGDQSHDQRRQRKRRNYVQSNLDKDNDNDNENSNKLNDRRVVSTDERPLELSRATDSINLQTEQSNHILDQSSFGSQSQPQSHDRSYSCAPAETLAELESRLLLVERFVKTLAHKLYAAEARIAELSKCECRRGCQWNGQYYNDGAEWKNKCDFCSCHSGAVTCKHVTCPNLEAAGCRHESHQMDGQCCPVCPKTCQYQNQTIAHGHRIKVSMLSDNNEQTINENNNQHSTCKECTCHNGQIKCVRVLTRHSLTSTTNENSDDTMIDHQDDHHDNRDHQDEYHHDYSGSSRSINNVVYCPSIVDCPREHRFHLANDCCTYCRGFDFCNGHELAGRHSCHRDAICRPVHNINSNKSENIDVDAHVVIDHDDVRVCQCKTGFKGNGRYCHDIDECADVDTNHVCNLTTSTCVNLRGSYRCECRVGYHRRSTLSSKEFDQQSLTNNNERNEQMEQPKSTGNKDDIDKQETETEVRGECIDIDECASSELNKCSRFADCINLEGSYQCRCRRGFVGDGRHCHALGTLSTSPFLSLAISSPTIGDSSDNIDTADTQRKLQLTTELRSQPTIDDDYEQVLEEDDNHHHHHHHRHPSEQQQQQQQQQHANKSPMIALPNVPNKATYFYRHMGPQSNRNSAIINNENTERFEALVAGNTRTGFGGLPIRYHELLTTSSTTTTTESPVLINSYSVISTGTSTTTTPLPPTRAPQLITVGERPTLSATRAPSGGTLFMRPISRFGTRASDPIQTSAPQLAPIRGTIITSAGSATTRTRLNTPRSSFVSSTSSSSASSLSLSLLSILMLDWRLICIMISVFCHSLNIQFVFTRSTDN